MTDVLSELIGPSPRAATIRPQMALPYDQLIQRHSSQLTRGGTEHLPTPTDLAFSGVSPTQVADALSGRNPLGTTLDQWHQLLEETRVTLAAEGLGSVQVGLSGSSVNFHSLEPFPTTLTEVVHAAHERAYSPMVVLERWKASPYAASPSDHLPRHHFFDSQVAMGFGRPSDLDFTLYGEAVDTRMRAFQREHGIPDSELIFEGVYCNEQGVPDPRFRSGGVYCVKYVRLAFPELGQVNEEVEEDPGPTGRLHPRYVHRSPGPATGHVGCHGRRGVMTLNHLFAFWFASELTFRERDLLRNELEFEFTEDKAGSEIAERDLGPYADVYLSAGPQPGMWTIDAVAAPGKPVDELLVEDVRKRIRSLLDRISTSWSETGPQGP